MSYLIFFIVVCMLVKVSSTSKAKGKRGESQIKDILHMLPKEYYRVLNDVMLKNGENTSQIDHVVICRRGLFIIETKNYGGSILGNESDRMWIQKFGSSINEFYNPILQNKGHINAVLNNITLKNIPIVSVVVFNSRGNIEQVNATNSNVIYNYELLDFIMEYKGESKISMEDIKFLYESLKENNLKGLNVRKMHVKGIKENKLYKNA